MNKDCNNCIYVNHSGDRWPCDECIDGYDRFVEKECDKCKYAEESIYNLPCRECGGFNNFELKEEEEEKMCQSCGEERKFKCELSCGSCKFEGLPLDEPPCDECNGYDKYTAKDEVENTCNNCGHKDKDKEDSPCCVCMDFDEWQPQPDVTQELQRAVDKLKQEVIEEVFKRLPAGGQYTSETVYSGSVFDGLREQVLQMKDRADYEFSDEDTRLAAKVAYGNVLMVIDDIILGKSRE